MLAWRVRRQHLERRASALAVLDVVGDIAGVHAQLMSSAELTLWARVEGLGREAVSRALWQERRLVKTWAMRGTLHVLPAAELPLWVAAQGVIKPRHHTGSWLRYFGLDRAEADAMLAAIPQALEGRTLTRQELADEVARLTGLAHLSEKLQEGFGALLKPAAFRGDLCFAPSAGQNVRFARPRDWLGEWQPVETAPAIRKVVRRYLAAYGPATREEFARWFGMTSAPQAERLIRELGDRVVQIEVDGARAWCLAEHVAAMGECAPAGTVRLLPAFDHYVVAAPRDRDAVLPASLRGRVYRPQGWLSPVVLLDGRMVGVWRHEVQADRLRIEVEAFAGLPAGARSAVGAEAERLAAHLGHGLELAWR